MNSTNKIKPVSSELSGIWIKRSISPYERILVGIYRLCTLFIYIIMFLFLFSNLGLVLFATILITGTVVLILEGYTQQYPHISFPLSQMIILILCAYFQFFELLAETDLFDIIEFPLIPNLGQIVLGILITLRIFIGIGLVRAFAHGNSRIMLSDHYKETLKAFKTNLMYFSDETPQKASEPQTKHQVKSFIQYVLMSITVVFILLFPMWMNIFLSISIYPYIILILGATSTVILIIYLSPKKGPQKEVREIEN